MRRALGLLTLLAIGGLVVAALMAMGTIPHCAGIGHVGIGRFTVEPLSFVAGFTTAVLLARLRRLPWGHLFEAFGALFRVWRRNAAMLVLAALFAGILLYY